jgi:hypothetical protein
MLSGKLTVDNSTFCSLPTIAVALEVFGDVLVLPVWLRGAVCIGLMGVVVDGGRIFIIDSLQHSK